MTKMNNEIERRNLIQGAGLLGGVAAAATLANRSALALSPPGGPRPMTYEAKPLSLDPKSIRGISEKVLVSHYENNYVGAIKRLTAIWGPSSETLHRNGPMHRGKKVLF
jgi:superoxide dismutase, Fe-Mn family